MENALLELLKIILAVLLIVEIKKKIGSTSNPMIQR